MNKKSEYITLSNSFSCGIKLIDDQHIELVNMINDMYNQVSGSENMEYDNLYKIINKTIEYIKLHFATEEKLMFAAEFSGYAEHKQVHNSFILTVLETTNDFKSGKVSLYSFTKFIRDWVFSHIAVMDKQYFIYFKQLEEQRHNAKISAVTVDEKPHCNTRKNEFCKTCAHAMFADNV